MGSNAILVVGGGFSGITAALEGWSKLILVVVMVIGRVGILNFFSLGLGSKRPPLEYPEERIII